MLELGIAFWSLFWYVVAFELTIQGIKKLVVMIRVRVEVGKNIKKCCVDKDLDTDRSAAIYQ